LTNLIIRGKSGEQAKIVAKMDKKRIFVAIDISDEARQAVASYIESLRQDFADVPVRWERPEKLHITLKFAGSIDDEALRSLTSNVAAAAADSKSFAVTLAETGTFVKRTSRANVLWIGLQPRYVMDEMAAKIDPQRLRRRLKLHITIARIKDAKKAQLLIERHLNNVFEPVTFRVDEITVYESTLMPAGSIYNVLSRHRLGDQ